MQNLSRTVRFWVKSIIFGKNVAFVTLINFWYGAIPDFWIFELWGFYLNSNHLHRKWNDKSPEDEFLCFSITLKFKNLFIYSYLQRLRGCIIEIMQREFMELENFSIGINSILDQKCYTLLSELLREWCKKKAVDYCKTMNVVIVKKLKIHKAIV